MPRRGFEPRTRRKRRVPRGGWAKEVWDKLTKRGVTDGSRPGDLITREEDIVMLDRMGKK